MAEARLAVAFQFAVTDEGVVVNLDKEILKLMATSAYKSVKRRCNDAKNTFLKGVYPASPATWMFFLAAVLSAHYHEHETTVDMLQSMEKSFPGKHRFDRSTIIAICIVTMVTAIWVFTGVLLQFVLRRLLRNFEFLRSGGRGKTPLKTKLWLVALKVFSGFNPGLLSFQKCLPYLPLPSLEDTLKRHLKSVRPFMSGKDYQNVEKLTEEFQNGVGPKLQRYLLLKSLWSPNYVSDWWERFIYLRSRSPLMINSNYYGLGGLYQPPTTVQTARAANLIHAFFLYRKQIDTHDMKPLKLMGIYPLCATQYTRQFNTTRIPGKEEDSLMTMADSGHIVVYHKGRYYKVTVIFGGKLLKPVDIERKLQKIVEDEKSAPCLGEEKLAALTSGPRPVWADVRQKYFSHGKNKQSLDLIEKAAFFVALDDDADFFSKEQSTQSEMNSFCKRMLHGNGYNRWFDKTITFVVCANGQIGFNAEHSWADAPVMAQFWEWVCVQDVENLKYTSDGHCFGTPRFDWPVPMKLQWDLPDECVKAIEECAVQAKVQIDDVDQHLLVFEAFGKGDIKKMAISPDAFCQLAFQLAYYKAFKKCCLTYESAMTRLFRDGRTETVRSCTVDSANFVKAATDPSVPVAEKKRLLCIAAEYHINLCREAMTGQGVDRHLFCLYVVSQYLKFEVPFLKTVLSEPWTLSTSQTPVNQTMLLNLEKFPERACPGGGFGPVAEYGFGLSYIICGENLIFVHVSSKKSCQSMTSMEFSKLIEESMFDLRNYVIGGAEFEPSKAFRGDS